MSHLKHFLKYIKFLIKARNTKGHGVHSPFVFDFLSNVIYTKNQFYIFKAIESIRKDLNQNHQELFIKDLGTGVDRQATISSIARKSLQKKKYAQLFFRIIHQYKFQNILELGTSLGVTTAYLAATSGKTKCISLEGSPEIAAIARENFKRLNLNNIQTIEGNIDETLTQALNLLEKVDFALIDANHQSNAVLSYFEQVIQYSGSNTILVIDDIYWSDDMEEAWKLIKLHPKVTTTIDLFQLGIVFLKPDLHKKHYKLYY